MKIIAFYLPQFHETPENNKWWGQGFTEWTNVRKSKSLFPGHYQPRIPLGNKYYNLLDNDVKKWQIEIAKKYGIYGFCAYHYWFNGKLMLEKPMEQYLEDTSLDFPFCFSWANEPWTKAWAEGKSEILLEQDFTDKNDWVNHFNYLLPFFKDHRYMKENGNPIFVIYVPHIIPTLSEMMECWNNMAKENGFEKIVFIYQSVMYHVRREKTRSLFDYGIEFQPGYAENHDESAIATKIFTVRKYISKFLQKKFKLYISASGFIEMFKHKPVRTIVKYDDIWNKILLIEPFDKKMIPGALKDWDNTPRYGRRGKVFEGVTPEKFKQYFKQLIINTKEKYHKDTIFFFAWNEWGEGGYLEPDEKYEYRFLEAINESLIETNERKTYKEEDFSI